MTLTKTGICSVILQVLMFYYKVFICHSVQEDIHGLTYIYILYITVVLNTLFQLKKWLQWHMSMI